MSFDLDLDLGLLAFEDEKDVLVCSVVRLQLFTDNKILLLQIVLFYYPFVLLMVQLFGVLRVFGGLVVVE